jgi:uncharacterized membrane protein YjgN (DUF898 family)
MALDKTFEFHGKAGGYFVVALVNLICAYIPIFGWAFTFNFTNNWVAENATINGKNLKYTAGYGETLKFIFINALLLIITLGIYIFWFVPKSYRYIADHLVFADEVVAEVAPVAADAPTATVETGSQPAAEAITEPAADKPEAPKPVIVQ